MAEKLRLDVVLHERGLVSSREKARALVMAGEVRVDGQIVDKPGTRIAPDALVEVKTRPQYVSRGGEKLAAALDMFPVEINGQVCADVGASTGGFTDCLLQHGAQRVYAIDVGYGQLDYRLRQNNRVIVMERTNARYVDRLPEPVGLVVMDASFISLRLLLPAVMRWVDTPANIIALIKPQFEAGKGQVGKGGVIKDRAIHRQVLHAILTFADEQGLNINGLIPSPLKGPSGNTEFLVWLGYNTENIPKADIPALIETALNSC